jgi:FAD/FMN-containing dehydrogenase
MIAESGFSGLRNALRGPLLMPGHDEYDQARKIHNAMIDRHPAAIACCASAADVIAAVKFARTNDVQVSVRGAGHNVAGISLRDGALLIDLSNMKGIDIAAEQRTVRVDPGVTWAELNNALQPYELAATGGYVGTTGVSGLTLGGGLGWMVRKHGCALDNLLSADVVLADGRMINASETENPDLFWAIRGGGGISA